MKEFTIGMLSMLIFVSSLCGFAYATNKARNSASETIWNDGICATCDQRFVPYAVSNGTKYYVCYGCGTEVIRYYE